MNFTPDCNKHSGNIWSSREYIWKYTPQRIRFQDPRKHAYLFPGRVAQFQDPDLPPCERAEFPWILCAHVFSSVAARSFSRNSAEPELLPRARWRLPNYHDENSIRRRTSNISPGSAGRGLASMAVRQRNVAVAVPFATDTTTPVHLTGFTGISNCKLDCSVGSQRPTLSTPLTTCAPASNGSTLVKIPRLGRRMTTTIRRASPLVTCLMSAWAMTICSTATVQVEPSTHSHQCDEQDYTLQLFVTFKRDALSYATELHS